MKTRSNESDLKLLKSSSGKYHLASRSYTGGNPTYLSLCKGFQRPMVGGDDPLDWNGDRSLIQHGELCESCEEKWLKDYKYNIMYTRIPESVAKEMLQFLKGEKDLSKGKEEMIKSFLEKSVD